MTRAMLDADQLGAVTSATGFGRLVSLDEVAATIAWLCSAQSSGINGQSLTVDLGFSNVRSI
jgi:NAD(P)-dependent dehydrogenase (short-subunit alcohol dehydrogenase family)